MIAVVELELGPADRRFADLDADFVVILLPAAPLASIRPKTRHRDAKRPASGTMAAGGVEKHVAEMTPAGLHPRFVLRRSDLADINVFQAPELIREVAACAGWGDVGEERFHVGP